MVSGKDVLTRACVRCERSLSNDANVCPHCGHDYRPLMMGRAWEEENTPLPPIGGALIALSGTAQIVDGVLWLSGFDFGLDFAENGSGALHFVIGLAVIIVGAFAVFVSSFAMTRRRLAVSLTGGLAALGGGALTVMYTLSITATCTGLIGILMIALARDEFVD